METEFVACSNIKQEVVEENESEDGEDKVKTEEYGSVYVKAEPLEVEITEDDEDMRLESNVNEDEEIEASSNSVNVPNIKDSSTAGESLTSVQASKIYFEAIKLACQKKKTPTKKRKIKEETNESLDEEEVSEDKSYTCVNGVEYTCNKCDYRTIRHSDVKRHMRTHGGSKPFSCELCEYKAADRSSVKKHMIKHTGIKPFFCPHCNYRAPYQSTLDKHIKIHFGEKPYECQLCEYKTTFSSALKKHMSTHTGDRPYACPHCDFRAIISSGLQRHLRTHTGEKPYACSQCDYRAGRLEHLRNHERKHGSAHFLLNGPSGTDLFLEANQPLV